MARKRKRIKVVPIIIIILLGLAIAGVVIYNNKMNKIETEKQNTAKKLEDIKKHYNQIVKTNKLSKIYTKTNDEYLEAGSIGKDLELTLDDTDIDKDTKYFKIKDFEGKYYIEYEDVQPIESITEIFEQDRYKKYIPFNENIITSDKASFYNESDELVYTFEKQFDMPIIIKDKDRYGVEFNNQLLYIKKEDVKETKENHNTDKSNTNHIGTLNYHFFWDDSTESASECNQIICHSKSQFKSHLDLINEMGLLTITMKEAEMYIDGKVRLPKSVLITIDDGWRADGGIKILNEYKMHATLFVITGSYDPKGYLTEDNKYVELQSHTDKLHDGGKCPGGRGGGLKCLPRDTILNDLKTSREKLNGAIALCYPFYEYNNYTIELAKEAGFTMGFAGESSYADNHFKVGSDKFTIPRFVIVTYTSIYDLKSYLS